jgi:hypothetical protein
LSACYVTYKKISLICCQIIYAKGERNNSNIYPGSKLQLFTILIFSVLVLCTQVNMFVMLLWVYIHTGQAWKICLATVGIEPTSWFPPWPGIFLKLAWCGYTLRVTSQTSLFTYKYIHAPYNNDETNNQFIIHKLLIRIGNSMVSSAIWKKTCTSQFFKDDQVFENFEKWF